MPLFFSASLLMDGDVEAHLIALRCGNPPKGTDRWTLRLLAEKLVELEIAPKTSHETVRQALKKRVETSFTSVLVHTSRRQQRIRGLYGGYSGCV